MRELNYNLRSKNDFNRTHVNTANFGFNSLGYFAPNVWAMIPSELKTISDFEKFKSEIRKWEPLSCKCKLCRPYIHNLGYI